MLIPPCWFEKRASETEEQHNWVGRRHRGHAYLKVTRWTHGWWKKESMRITRGLPTMRNLILLGFRTLYIKRIIRMFKYWFKLFQTSNCVYKLPMIFYRVNVKTPIFGVVIGQTILKISCLIWVLITCGSINTTI